MTALRSSEFVGRRRELEQLDAALDTVCGGRATTVLVAGDAGIGKSRLVDEFCDRARLRGAVAAAGKCVPDGMGLPYGPVLGLVRELVQQHGESTAALVLERMRVGAAPRTEAADRALPLAEDLARTHIFESIMGLVDRLSVAAPLILVFEDVHWADATSTQIIDFLTRTLADARVLIVATYRPEQIGRGHPLRSWLAELAGQAHVVHLGVEGLERVDFDQLVLAVCERAPDRNFRDAVWERTRGNPFFAEQIALSPEGELPDRLRDAVLGRLNDVSDGARRLMQVMSVIGTPTAHELLCSVAYLADVTVSSAVVECRDRHVIVTDDTSYRFRHALLREAVYADLLPAEQRALHKVIASALTAHPELSAVEPSLRPAEVASQWWAAGAWHEMIPHAWAAAQNAVAVGAFTDALTQLERVLHAAVSAPDGLATVGISRAQVLEQATEIAYLVEDASERCIELAKDAIAAWRDCGDRIGETRCTILLGRALWGVGDSGAAFVAYDRALELSAPDAATPVRAWALAEHARGLMLMSRFREAQPCCQQAIEVARAVGAHAVEGHALNTLGCCVGLLGDLDTAVELLREAVEIAEDGSSPDDLDRAYTNLSAMLLERGDLEQTVAMVYDTEAVSEALYGVGMQGAAGNAVEGLIRLGRYDEAERLLTAATTRIGLGICAAGPYLYPAWARIYTGRYAEADLLLQRADEMTADLGDVQQRGTYLVRMAELALGRGRPDEALAHIEAGLTIARETDDVTTRVQFCQIGIRALADEWEQTRSATSDRDRDTAYAAATEFLTEIAQLLDRRAADGHSPTRELAATASWAQAERSRIVGSDAELWLQTAALWDEAHEPWPQAYCAMRAAEALVAARERIRAAGALQRAHDLAVGIGAEPLLQAVRQLATRARIALNDGGPDAEQAPTDDLVDRFRLTQREVEVLAHLANGATDREIADAMFISRKTASVHVSNLLRKLEVPNRVEAGKIAQARQSA